jgi:Zn-dependent peptidase ImmA (M78 family)
MDLMGKAEELGVTVIVGELPEGWWGSWNHRTRTITLLEGLAADRNRSVLAHELGHAVHNHKTSTPETEAEARAWAARALINPARMAAKMKAMNWLGVMAKELGVMPSDVAAFYRSMTDEERLCIRDLITMEPQGFGKLSNASR